MRDKLYLLAYSGFLFKFRVEDQAELVGAKNKAQHYKSMVDRCLVIPFKSVNNIELKHRKKTSMFVIWVHNLI